MTCVMAGNVAGTSLPRSPRPAATSAGRRPKHHDLVHEPLLDPAGALG